MLQVVDDCNYKTYEQTGAFWVTIVFLTVFVILIVIDTVLTFTALRKALTKDERETEIEKRIKTKQEYLENLTRAIDGAQKKAASLVKTQPALVPASYACDVLPKALVAPSLGVRDAEALTAAALRRGLAAGRGRH